jgi:hypothetical protein
MAPLYTNPIPIGTRVTLPAPDAYPQTRTGTINEPRTFGPRLPLKYRVVFDADPGAGIPSVSEWVLADVLLAALNP